MKIDISKNGVYEGDFPFTVKDAIDLSQIIHRAQEEPTATITLESQAEINLLRLVFGAIGGKSLARSTCSDIWVELKDASDISHRDAISAREGELYLRRDVDKILGFVD